MEDEHDLNWYSYRYRNYDPAIGRFFNVDPLSDSFAYNGVYNFSENRVVDAFELEGLEAELTKEGMVERGLEFDGDLADGEAFGDAILNEAVITMNVNKAVDVSAPITNMEVGQIFDINQIRNDLFTEINNITSNAIQIIRERGIVQIEAKGSIGAQVGFKSGFVSGFAGFWTTDIETAGWSTENGWYAEKGDGRGHNYIDLSASLLNKKYSVGGVADYITNDVIPPEYSDPIAYYTSGKNGHWESEFKAGPRTYFSPKNNINAGGLKVRAKKNTDCTFCIDTSIGARVLFGGELKIKIGIKDE